jgi:hypothetical protein
VGDAVEVRDRVTGAWGIIPLAGPANRQGRIAADTIFGRPSRYEGTWGTAILRLFNLSAGCTGANEKALRLADIPYQALHLHPGSHAAYFFVPRGRVFSCRACCEQEALFVLTYDICSLQGDASREIARLRGAYGGRVLRCARCAAKPILKPETPDHEKGFADDATGHLGCALVSIGKDDGNFDDAHTLAPEPMGHFDLEAVPIGSDLSEIDGFESAPPKTFESAGWIGEWHACNDLNVACGAETQQKSAEGPVDDSYAPGVARAKNKVRMGSRFDELGNVSRVV